MKNIAECSFYLGKLFTAIPNPLWKVDLGLSE